MTIQFSNQFDTFVREAVKANSPKESLYNYIDQLEKDEIPSFFYSSFKDSLNKYQEFISDKKINFFIKYSLANHNLNNYSNFFLNEIFSNIEKIFYIKYKSDYISTADKSLIRSFAEQLYDSYSYSDYTLKNLEHKLERKLGDAFKEWSSTNFMLSLHELVVDEISNYDSHRYTDDVLKCFSEAAIKDDFNEEVSLCQYKMHGVDILGDSSYDEL